MWIHERNVTCLWGLLLYLVLFNHVARWVARLQKGTVKSRIRTLNVFIMDSWCTWIPLLQIRERGIMHLWSFSCYFDIVCLTTLIDVFQNDRKGMQNRAINQNGLKRHQVQLKRTVTVPIRSPLLLLTPFVRWVSNSSPRSLTLSLFRETAEFAASWPRVFV